jgi:integral membrane protein
MSEPTSTSNDPVWLRRSSTLEGISALLLFFVAMPLKYAFGMPEAVKVIGMAHGLLFVAFGLLLLYHAMEARWSILRVALALVVVSLPFGAFWFERDLRKNP